MVRKYGKKFRVHGLQFAVHSSKRLATKDVLLILFFPLFLVLLSSSILVFNSDFYNLLFKISDAHPQAEEFGQKTLNYLMYKNNFIQGFRQEEVDHMFEVRKIILIFNLAFLILLFFYIFKINRFILFYGSLLNVALTIIFAFVSFNFLFTEFHEVLAFNQWQFPGNYVMVQVFNREFFQYFFLHIIGLSVVLSITGLFVCAEKIRKWSFLKQYL